jgi:hypothetical protein
MCFSHIDRQEKDLDAAKEVTRGAGAPSAKTADRPWLVAIRLPPHVEGQGRSPPVRQGSRCTRGRGTHSAHALSPRLMIGKEH